MKSKVYKIQPTEFQSMVPFPVYGYRIYIIFTNNVSNTADNLMKQGLLEKNHGVDDSTEATTIRMPNQSYTFMIFPYDVSLNSIAHETYHALSNMFNWIGARHEEEVFAYSLGYTIGLVTQDQKIAQKKLEKLKIILDNQKQV